MKKNAPLLGLIFAVGIVLFAFAVYFLFLAKKNYYLVDNPTPDTYYFKINNGTEKIISSGQFLKVDLNKGTNRIKVFDKEKNLLYDSAFTVKKIRGLVNITHGDYYIHRQYYGVIPNKDSLLLSQGITMIDSKEYFGGPKHFNKLYTDDFYYNIDEKYDKLIKNIDKVESRTKIFRKQDFLNYYKEVYKF